MMHGIKHQSIVYKTLKFTMLEGGIVSEFLVEGPTTLNGEIMLQGSKNSTLPILASTVLCSGECILHNCPNLTDVNDTLRILRDLGATVKADKNDIVVNSKDISRFKISNEMMKSMRSSIIFLGALISKLKKAEVAFPGGCKLGPRPIDLHLKALTKMGISIEEQGEKLICFAKNKIKGSSIFLPIPSVGATENIILAGVLAEGKTTIINAAKEPEISDLCDFLNKCGANIYGAGTGVIVINGAKNLSGAEHNIIPDRIAAITFMSAAAITGGDIEINNSNYKHIKSVIPIFRNMGCEINADEKSLRIVARDKLKFYGLIKTMPYPGFPTDAQALLMAVLSCTNGRSVFIENMFSDRFSHVNELIKLGADIKVKGKTATVTGVNELIAADIEAKDLRCAAALSVAALKATGQTKIKGISHLDRGYENLEGDFKALGANIKRI